VLAETYHTNYTISFTKDTDNDQDYIADTDNIKEKDRFNEVLQPYKKSK